MYLYIYLEIRHSYIKLAGVNEVDARDRVEWNLRISMNSWKRRRKFTIFRKF